MNKKIYNNEKFHQQKLYINVRNLFKAKKYISVIKEASKYLEMFPEDLQVRFMRAKVYRKLEKFDEAITDLNYMLEKELDSHALTELYYIYYYLNMYNEAIDLLPLVYDTKCIKPHSVVLSELVMKKQLGININVKEGARCDYIKNQILNYDDSLALDHIEKHLVETEENTSVFNEKINLKKLYNIIKENIDNKNKVNTEELMEIHYFAIPNVGYSNGSNCNFVKVVVIPNTNNILTMYPVSDVDINYINALNIDFSIIFKENEKKVKTLSNSRVDRFNKKYNIN